MKDIIFKRTELEDKEIMTKYFDEHPSRSCERTFVNVFLWSRQYPVKWAIVEGAMVFKSEDEGHVAYAFPAGTDEHVKRALDKMKTYSEERGYPFRMYNVTPDDFARLESWYPGRFEIEYDRDEADYVYESEKLATLSGKKMHGKKNHVNRFQKEFEGRWSYESMKKENLEECFQMALKWRKENGCNDDTDKNAEMCVTMNALRLFEELDLKGGILRIDGKIVAFTIGEPICPDTFVVHIEKAYADWNRGQAENRMNRLISQYKDGIELVISNNDEMALGAVEAYRKAGYEQAEWPVIFGIDGLDDALEAIKAGEMQGTVYNDKEDQALQIAKLAVEIFRGEDVNRNKLKEGRYYVSEYQPVYSSNVEDFIKRQTR